jgi:hypothetical protein
MSEQNVSMDPLFKLLFFPALDEGIPDEVLPDPVNKTLERFRLESALGKRVDPGWDEAIGGGAVVEKREVRKPLEKVTRCEEHFDEYGMREVHWFDADGKLIDIRFPLPEVAVE